MIPENLPVIAQTDSEMLHPGWPDFKDIYNFKHIFTFTNHKT